MSDKKEYVIQIDGNLSELLILPLSQQKSRSLRKNGLPDITTRAGENFFSQLEENSHYTELLLPSDEDDLTIWCNDTVVIDNEFREIKRKYGTIVYETQDFLHSFYGKHVLVCIKTWGNCTWYLDANDPFDPLDIRLCILSFNIFNFYHENCLSLSFSKYDYSFSSCQDHLESKFYLLSEGEEPIEIIDYS